MGQDGLIDVQDISSAEYKECLVGNMTSKGFDFLENIKEDTVWNKTKSIIVEKGLPMVTGTIKVIAESLVSAAAEGAMNAILKNKGVI